MGERTFTTYRYRWVVLFFFSMMQCIMQMLWITFASITGEASTFYNVTPMQIGFLSMVFMIMYVFFSFPASWAIDTFGIRKGVGFGVILTGIFALTRAYGASNFTWVLVSMTGIAIAQPFILNSLTAMASKWFPMKERATAVGIASLFLFVGMMIGLALTPVLTLEFGIPGMLKIYGYVTLFFVVAYLIFVKEKPPTPPDEIDNSKVKVAEGLKHIFSQRSMILLIVFFFFALGMFTAVTTWIEQMLTPRGFSIVQAGNLGAMIMIGGIIGCLIVPTISDKKRKRKPFIILSALITIPTLIGLTFANSYMLLLFSGFIFGFFFLGAGPIIYQYAAETSYPAPEATSQGLLMLAGNISGIIYIFAMDFFRDADGSMTPFMIFMITMTPVSLFLATRLKESVIVEN